MKLENQTVREVLNHAENVGSSNALPEKIQPAETIAQRRKRRDTSDGRVRLAHAGREAVAQFSAAPVPLRKFKSLTALASHFKTSRMSVHRWRQEVGVMRRTHWLSMRNKIAGDLLARQAWFRIMKTVIKMAMEGDFRAIKFIESRAWAEELEIEQSQLSASISVADLFGADEGGEEEGQDDIQQAEGGDR